MNDTRKVIAIEVLRPHAVGECLARPLEGNTCLQPATAVPERREQLPGR